MTMHIFMFVLTGVAISSGAPTPAPGVTNLESSHRFELPPLPKLEIGSGLPTLDLGLPMLPPLARDSESGLPALPGLPEVKLPTLNLVPVPLGEGLLLPPVNPEFGRAQARSVLDDIVSRYPTLIDNFATLLAPVSNLALNGFPQGPATDPAIPGLPGLRSLTSSPLNLPSPVASLNLPKISNVVPSLPSLSGVMESQPMQLTSALAQSAASTFIDNFLTNIRNVAASPLVQPLVGAGGQPTNLQNLGVNLPGLPSLQLPEIRLPVTVLWPNEQGLQPNDFVEALKRNLSETSVPNDDGSHAVRLTVVGPVNYVQDLKPLNPKTTSHFEQGADTSTGPLLPEVSGPKNPGNESESRAAREIRHLWVPGSLLSGPADIQIDMGDSGPAAVPKDVTVNGNIRMGLIEEEKKFMIPLTYLEMKPHA